MDALRDALPDHAKDLRLNLGAVLDTPSLTPAQRWGTAVATAAATRHPALLRGILEAARAEVEEAVVDDALAAAALMAMNNVFYRFRHFVKKPVYGDLPARLRMTRIARPLGSKVDFELFCLAVSAVNGCEVCVCSHEAVVVRAGISEQQVHDAVRIAATVHGVATALPPG